MAIVLAFAAFVLAVIMHGPAMRLPIALDSVRRFLLIGVPIGLALVAVSLALVGPTIRGFAAILFYALLCELYIFLFTLVIGSVSVSILVALRDGPIEATSTANTFDTNEMVRLRIERLIRFGFLEGDGDQIVVTREGKKLHRTYIALRCFFGHLNN